MNNVFIVQMLFSHCCIMTEWCLVLLFLNVSWKTKAFWLWWSSMTCLVLEPTPPANLLFRCDQVGMNYFNTQLLLDWENLQCFLQNLSCSKQLLHLETWIYVFFFLVYFDWKPAVSAADMTVSLRCFRNCRLEWELTITALSFHLLFFVWLGNNKQKQSDIWYQMISHTYPVSELASTASTFAD